MKLELKHLVSYLPYGVHLMNDFGNWHNTTLNKSINIYKMLEMKLILRPLSDLTKEIEHNGEKFVPLRKLEDLFPCVEFYNDDELSYLFSDTSCNGDMYHSIELSLTLEISSKLFEWHFDVFGLIEQNLAININTL